MKKEELEKIHSKKKILNYFLRRDITSTEEILSIFQKMPGAIRGESSKGYPYVFVPGKAKNKVLLTAHCDTVWDGKVNCKQDVKYKKGVFSSGNKSVGIGADDRAGIAMLYLLKNSGNSLLITTGEERKMSCSRYLSEREYELINDHNFIVQLDKCGNKEFKCYSVGSEEFIEYIKQRTGFKYINPYSYTDIVSLCKTICGVNLSVGYYNEHSADEYLIYDEWKETFKAAKKLIKNSRKFELDKKNIDELYEDEDKFGYNDFDLLDLIEQMNEEIKRENKDGYYDIPEIDL